jgi:hypothetical protein
MLVSHTFTFAIDPAEHEPEELPAPAEVKVTNPEQEQDKLWCI